MKWKMILLAAFSTVLLLTMWPSSENSMRSQGLEELESYILDEGLQPMSDVRLCDLIPDHVYDVTTNNVDSEGAMTFLCRVDLKDGTLHVDIVFALSGEIIYKNFEVGE